MLTCHPHCLMNASLKVQKKVLRVRQWLVILPQCRTALEGDASLTKLKGWPRCTSVGVQTAPHRTPLFTSCFRECRTWMKRASQLACFLPLKAVSHYIYVEYRWKLTYHLISPLAALEFSNPTFWNGDLALDPVAWLWNPEYVYCPCSS